MMKRILLIAVLLKTVMACDQETVFPDDEHAGYNFYPLKVGSYNIYHVENIDYKVTGEIVTSAFELKVDVVDSFINQAGTISYIIHYAERMSAGDAWKVTRACTARKDKRQAVLVEDNIPFLKISFPVEAGKTWDGNALNAKDQDDYRMDSLFSTYITPTQDTIQHTLTIIQEDNQDFISQQLRRYEIYARHAGLVYKEDINLNYCTDPECLGQQVVESGYEYRQYLVTSNP